MIGSLGALAGACGEREKYERFGQTVVSAVLATAGMALTGIV